MIKVLWKISIAMSLVYCGVILYRWIPVIWEIKWTDAVMFTVAMFIVMLEGIEDILGVEDV